MHHSQTRDEQPSRELLFVGRMQIYKSEKIPGTEFEGYDLINNSGIWTAGKPTETLLGNSGLFHVLFDNTPID